MASRRSNPLGNGLIAPLRRLGGLDFVSASGEPLIRSSITQILATEPGELPWRPSFGGNLDKFRNKNMTDDAKQMASSQIVTNLSRYESRVRIRNAAVESDGTTLTIAVVWDIPASGSSGVILGPNRVEVTI